MDSIKFSPWRSCARSRRQKLEPCFAEINVRFSQGKLARIVKQYFSSIYDVLLILPFYVIDKIYFNLYSVTQSISISFHPFSGKISSGTPNPSSDTLASPRPSSSSSMFSLTSRQQRGRLSCSSLQDVLVYHPVTICFAL